MRRALRARDEFLAVLGHELRNPLTPLVFHVRLLADRATRGAAGGEPIPADWLAAQLAKFDARLKRVLDTLDRVLDFSRLTRGALDLHLAPVDLAALARDVCQALEPEVAMSGSRLRIAADGEVIGRWDRVRLEQVCRNLLSNAIRYGAGGPIDVEVSGTACCGTLVVRDRGIGISPDNLSRIFELFERAGEPHQGGFGIGLWVVKHIVEALDGTVEVESVVSEGSTFVVTLPRSGPAARGTAGDGPGAEVGR